MTSRSSINEVPVPSILEDFEPGDRICFQGANNLVRFGTVVEIQDGFMWIRVTGFSKKPVRVRNTGQEKDNLFHVSQWRKMPDDTLLEVGDVLSTTCPEYTFKPGERESFTIKDIVPGKIIVLVNEDNEMHTGVDENGSLDSYLKDWELEG